MLPDDFIEGLLVCTARVGAGYFALDVATPNGQVDEVYRERVYCYELYHQMRLHQEATRWCAGFSLVGEVDKSGHPVFEKIDGLKGTKPDFIVHVPSQMDNNNNLAVIEVKRASVTTTDLSEDVKQVVNFISKGPYQLGICLVFGPATAQRIARWRDSVHYNVGAFGGRIVLLHHAQAGQKASVID